MIIVPSCKKFFRLEKVCKQAGTNEQRNKTSSERIENTVQITFIECSFFYQIKMYIFYDAGFASSVSYRCCNLYDLPFIVMTVA